MTAPAPQWQIIEGDALEVLAGMAPASFDAIVTDPPYGLGFMGKEWDSLPPGEAVAMGLLRVIKPGAHLVAFGGTRTYHRLACAIEDAGFEIRDSLMWIYGSGFPKSLNLDGEWEGWGTALKPAHEPIVLARKPLAGTVAANVAEHGCGALNMDGCRVEGVPSGLKPYTRAVAQRESQAANHKNVTFTDHPAGRWPPNVLLTHAADCGDECAEGCPVREMDRQSGELVSGTAVGGLHRRSNKTANCYGTFVGQRTEGDVCYGDSGGASRFFPRFRYEAKASTSEREAGLDGMERLHGLSGGAAAAAAAGDESYQLGGFNNVRPVANHHPTVKPVALMRWLCRLVTPPGGLILDPFLGSGTTMIAALQEGFRCVGIEREPEYVEIARRRVEEDMPLFNRKPTT